jgi:hypothetical protein
MNIKFVIRILSFAGIIFCFSCNNTKKMGKSAIKDSTNLSKETKNLTILKYIDGVYNTTGENECNINITIKKVNDNYFYKITLDGTEYSGKLIFENQEDKVYFTFDGKIGDNAPQTVGGLFFQDTLMIQNYGNSMNEYHYFKKCDVKFLEFKKQ